METRRRSMFAVMVRKHFNALLDDGRINHAFYDATSRLFFLQWSPAASSRIFIPYPFTFFLFPCYNTKLKKEL
jgi:hypothetical protein